MTLYLLPFLSSLSIFSDSSFTPMDPNSSEDLSNLFWELIDDEFMDNTIEEQLILILEREQLWVTMGLTK